MSCSMDEEDFRRIRYIAKSFAKKASFLEEEDLFQEGCCIFLKRIGAYDTTKGKKWDYMFWVVNGYLSYYVKTNDDLIHYSSTYDTHALDKYDIVSVWAAWGEVLDVMDQHTEECMWLVELRTVRDAIYSAMEERLTDRERSVIIMRFGLSGEEPLTLEQTGKRMNVSRERVRQVEARSLRKLRFTLAGYREMVGDV